MFHQADDSRKSGVPTQDQYGLPGFGVEKKGAALGAAQPNLIARCQMAGKHKFGKFVAWYMGNVEEKITVITRAA